MWHRLINYSWSRPMKPALVPVELTVRQIDNFCIAHSRLPHLPAYNGQTRSIPWVQHCLVGGCCYCSLRCTLVQLGQTALWAVLAVAASAATVLVPRTSTSGEMIRHIRCRAPIRAGQRRSTWSGL